MWSNLENKQFVVNGFLVERPPTLVDRLEAPWSSDYSLPYYDENNVLHCKPVVYFDHQEQKWGIRFQGVYGSECYKIFDTAAEASDCIRASLSEKPR